jgi:hypothetical protein
MTNVYQKQNVAALLFAVVATVLMTASLTLPWYYSSVKFSEVLADGPARTVNYTYITYDLFGTRTVSKASSRFANHSHTCTRSQNKVPEQVESYESLRSTSSTSVSSIFTLSCASAIIASLSSVMLSAHLLLFSVGSIRDMTLFKFGRTAVRNILHGLCLFLVISASVSCLAFLRLSAAFKKDLAYCVEGPCQSFYGSASFQHSAGTVVSAMVWAPQSGWFVAMVGAFASLMAVFLVAISRIPQIHHSDSSSDEHDMQQMIELETSADHLAGAPRSPSLLDKRAHLVLFVAAIGSAAAAAVIIWACARPQCAACISSALELGGANGLDGVVESIEMQVLPPPPAAWPSLKEGQKFYEHMLSSLAAVTDLGLQFDAKPHKNRVVARFLWQTLPRCANGNCSLPAPMANAVVRYRQVVSGSNFGSGDFTLKQNRRFRQSAASLPHCTTSVESDCNAKIEANYFWKGAGSSDVDITWQRSCTLRLKTPSLSSATPPVIRNVPDVLTFFSSAATAFGPNSEDAILYESGDCFHESDYKVGEAKSRTARQRFF